MMSRPPGRMLHGLAPSVKPHGTTSPDFFSLQHNITLAFRRNLCFPRADKEDLMSSTSAWKLRRLAPRAIRVHTRRAGDAPVLAVFAQTLPIKANAFIAAYDAAAKYNTAW